MSHSVNLPRVLQETIIPGRIILGALSGNIGNRPKESDLPDDVADSMSTAHTIADDLVQEVVLQILQTHGRDFRINAEEATPRTQIFTGDATSYCYHLDPLDGTFSYLNGRDGFAIGAAFSRDLRFEASAIYFPAQDRLYLAQRGKGVRVETALGEEVSFTRQETPADFYIQRRAEKLVPIVEKLGLQPLDTMGTHHGMAAIARGDAQVLLYHRASPHDFGIPQVIVEEAGGICTDLDGNPVSYDAKWNRVPWFLAFADHASKDRFFEVYSSSAIAE